MILEGIVTTIGSDGRVNIAPMGPLVDEHWQRLVFRPYQSSTTFANLRHRGEGVLHVTDDVELLARAAVGQLDPLPPMHPAADVTGWILSDACRWYAFRVSEIDDRQPRAEIQANVVGMGRFRDFFGFNRAKHAVVEAAILATRLDHLPRAEILAELARLTIPLEKTGGPQELRAMEFIKHYIETH